MESSSSGGGGGSGAAGARYGLIVLLAAAAVYLPGLLSPPSLMDDVDAVQAQIARTMLETGDGVTARLNGVAYLEKSPLIYWSMAASFAVFGVSDTAARVPLVLTAIALCWLTWRFGRWAFGPESGLLAGLVLASSFGLWLYTRIQIPDAMLTATVTLAMWSFLRAIDPQETRSQAWAAALGLSLGCGLILKGLIAAVLPAAAIAIFLAVTGQLWQRAVWRRLRPVRTLLLALAVAAPWHIAATLANPPYFDFTWGSRPGEYHGFFWFYFLNEHVFRFLNMRHPRDYNTVPRLLFWALHLLWMFPFTALAGGVRRLAYRGESRAARARLLAVCWIGFLLVFFSFSTTQEYYTMPCYPAMALLIGNGMAEADARWGRRALALLLTLLALALGGALAWVWGLPAPGDIAAALTSNPELYTLSLGHVADLTVGALAYLKLPLGVAALAFGLGGAAAWRWRGRALAVALAAMMAIFFQAARLALIAFDPYLSSRPLAEALNRAPEGGLILDNQYYAFSSVIFYTNRRALLLNGRVNNLEYGSYAPGAPDVFIDDAGLKERWAGRGRWYLCVEGPRLSRIEEAVGKSSLHPVAAAGGKFVFSNQPLER